MSKNLINGFADQQLILSLKDTQLRKEAADKAKQYLDEGYKQAVQKALEIIKPENLLVDEQEFISFITVNPLKGYKPTGLTTFESILKESFQQALNKEKETYLQFFFIPINENHPWFRKGNDDLEWLFEKIHKQTNPAGFEFSFYKKEPFRFICFSAQYDFNHIIK